MIQDNLLDIWSHLELSRKKISFKLNDYQEYRIKQKVLFFQRIKSISHDKRLNFDFFLLKPNC